MLSHQMTIPLPSYDCLPIPCPPSQAQPDAIKLLTVLNEDMDEEDLRAVLMECLKDAPGAEEDDGKKQPSKASALVRRVFCLPR